jgi:hypothetical protein
MQNTLSSEQCYTIGSFLRTAAGVFETFTKQDVNARIVEQFARQQKEAEDLATLFENAGGATLEILEEEEV